MITFFKVLPTDERYQRLNFLQKIVLLYSVNKDLAEKMDIAKSFSDRLTFYINPEIFMKEQELEQGKTGGSMYDKINAEFDQHHISGHSTGRMQISKDMKKAIQQAWEAKKRGYAGIPSFSGSGEQKIITANPVKKEEELG